MAAPVMGNHPVALVDKVEHLGIPIVTAQRPAMVKDNRLSRLGPPVLVKDAGAVLGCNGVHCLVPFLMLACRLRAALYELRSAGTKTEQSVSNPRRPVPNGRRRWRPPHGRQTGTGGE